MKNEEWRNVPGYEGMYQISSFGRVKSLARTFPAKRKGVQTEVRMPERILTPYLTAGYPSVALCRAGKQRTTYIHQLVCEAWHGPRPEGHDVAHYDGDKANSRPHNLRWATRHENILDKNRHGKQPRGDDLWFTKVPDAAVPAIRASTSKLVPTWAAKFGVSESCIREIRAGRERQHA